MIKAFRFRQRQQGIATVLVVVLMGAMMTAVASGLVFSLKGTQKKQVAAHASTHAQAGLWSGVEAFRRYLGSLDEASLNAIHGVAVFNIDLGGRYGTVTAKGITVTPTGAVYHVGTTIVNIHGDAKSSAAVEVMFEVNPATPPNDTIELSASLDFYDNLHVAGGIEFNVSGGAGAIVNVDGDVSFGGTAVVLGRLSSTGNITFGNGGMSANEIFSNGDLNIQTGATVGKAWALGSIGVATGTTVDNVYANGDIDAYGASDLINSRSNVTLKEGPYGSIKAGGTVTVDSWPAIQSVEAIGDIHFIKGPPIGTVVGMGSVRCDLSWWADYTSMSVNGSASGCKSDASKPYTIGDNNVIDIMPELTPFSMSSLVIDVRMLKGKANFAFRYSSANNRVEVDVLNINGIPDGTYGLTSVGKVDYLCEFSGGSCTVHSSNSAVCMGDGGGCLRYDTGLSEWKMEGVGSAPGIFWFEGSLVVKYGAYSSTFLVTGDFESTADFMGLSVNYGGYAEVCQAAGSYISSRVSEYVALFENQYPANLCHGGDYHPIPVGNVGIAAGSYTDGVYGGGNIDLGALTEVFGSILAGNYFNSTGDATVHGYVTAAALRTPGQGKNSLGNKTIINLIDAPDTFDATIAPSMEPPCQVNCSSPDSYSSEKSKILWARYL